MLLQGSVRRIARSLHAADVLVVAFSAVLVALALVFHGRIPMWRAVVAASGGVAFGLVTLAVLRERTGSRALGIVHDWSFAPVVYAIYIQTHWIIGPLHLGRVADDTLIAIDRAMFGLEPVAWIGRLARPWLTEIAQIAYTLFYPLILVIGGEIYARCPRRDFYRFVFACASGFLASYVGYLIVPAVGPRFTLYDFSLMHRDLPGLLLTPALRAFVNAGGLVPSGLSREETLLLTQRDVFPSGHTLMTLVSMWWSWRLGLRVRWGVLAVGVVLIFATVYLRYHYVIDVLAGAAVAAVGIWAVPPLYRWIVTELQTRESREPAS